MTPTVESLMSRDVVSVAHDASLDRALRLMDEHGVRHLPVLREGEFVGMLTDRDLLQATGGLPERIREVYQDDQERPHQVSDVTLQPARWARLADDAVSALTIEAVASGSGGVAVVEDGQVIGMLTETDLLRHLIASAGERGRTSVRECMSRDLVTLPVEGNLGQALDLARTHRVRHVLVTDPSGIVGLLSDRDLRRALGAGRKDSYAVVEMMSAHPRTIEASSSLAEAARRLLEGHYSALPVLQDGLPAGMLTTRDLLDFLIDV